MALDDLVRAFVTVFPAELPDKSMFAVIVLVTRYRRPGWVWLGAALAFALHVAVAVLAGSAIGLLPDTVVQVVVLLLFLGGALVLLRAARRAESVDDDVDAPVAHAGIGATVAGSFALIGLAEWGDLTQLATAGLVAGGGAPVATGLGAFAALCAVAALAAAIGRQLVARVPIHKVNLVGAAVFFALALWTALELLR